MLFLHKLLPVFALPLGLVFLLLVVAWWKKRRWPVFAAAALLYVVSMPVVGDGFLRSLESKYPAMTPSGAPESDAIVVLGGIFSGVVPDGRVPNLADAVERLEAGIRLRARKKAPWLVFTGGRIPWEGRPRVEGEDSRHEAIARGISPDAILVTREVGNTAEEADAVAELAREHGWKRILLVTSAWHMPRARRQFSLRDVEVVPFPVDYRAAPGHPLTLLDFLPSAAALGETELALRECYGAAYYAMWAKK